MAVLALIFNGVMEIKLMNDDDLCARLAKLDCFLYFSAVTSIRLAWIPIASDNKIIQPA